MSTPALTAYRATNYSPAVSMTIDDGDPGTAQTVAVMRNLVHQGRKDPFINRLAVWIVRNSGVREYDFGGERRAIFEWARRNIRFIRDIADMEAPRTARETVEVRAGDCDCMTVLLCSLLATIGNQVRIITVETRPNDPEFSHVYAEVLDGNRWVAVDTARPGARYGRSPEQYRRKWAWDVFSNYVQELGGSNADAQWNQFAPGVGRMGLAGYVAMPNAIRSMAPSRMARRMGRFGRIGDDIDWSGIAQAATAIGTSTSNIIQSSRANPLNIVPQGSYSAINALNQQALYGQQYGQNPFGGSVDLGGMIIPMPVLLLGGLALLMLAGRK